MGGKDFFRSTLNTADGRERKQEKLSKYKIPGIVDH